jgi:hypothetical protein
VSEKIKPLAALLCVLGVVLYWPEPTTGKPTPTELIRSLPPVTTEQIQEYRPTLLQDWAYIDDTHRQRKQDLYINLPYLCPSLDGGGFVYVMGNPVTRTGRDVLPGDSQYIVCSVKKEMYLKTGIIGVRLYGNAMGPFKPDLLVLSKYTTSGETKTYYWKYNYEGIPLLISERLGRLFIEGLVKRDINRRPNRDFNRGYLY